MRSFSQPGKNKGPYTCWQIVLDGIVSRDSGEIEIEISDELVVIKYRLDDPKESELLIYNWKLGELINKILCGPSCTFGFLASDSIFVFNSDDTQVTATVELLIYDNIRYRTDPGRDGQHSYGPRAYKSLVPHFQLDFPAFPPDTYTYLSVYAKPGPTRSTSGPAAFIPLPTTQIIRLSMVVNYDERLNRDEDYYDICLSKEKLLRLFSLASSPEPNNLPIRIPWDAWGERATRWFSSECL